jgi:hypothetical protein
MFRLRLSAAEFCLQEPADGERCTIVPPAPLIIATAPHSFMPPALLTISGYCKKDVYESLDNALASGDAERAVCLAAELACTIGEAGVLITYIVSTYARWYHGTDGALASRIGANLDVLAGTNAVMNRTPYDPHKRRAISRAEPSPPSSRSIWIRTPMCTTEARIRTLARAWAWATTS